MTESFEWRQEFSYNFIEKNIRIITLLGTAMSWLYGSWIYNYLSCNQCLSPLKLWVLNGSKSGYNYNVWIDGHVCLQTVVSVHSKNQAQFQCVGLIQNANRHLEVGPPTPLKLIQTRLETLLKKLLDLPLVCVPYHAYVFYIHLYLYIYNCVVCPSIYGFW